MKATRRTHYLLPLILVTVYPLMVRKVLRTFTFSLEVNWSLWILIGSSIAFLCFRAIQSHLSADELKLRSPNLKNIMLTLAAFCLLLAWGIFVRDNFPLTHNQEGLMVDFAKANTLFVPVLYANLCLIGPVNEEIMYRLFVIKGPGGSLPRGVDVMLSSTLFSLAHLHVLSLTDFLCYFVMGLIFALVFKATKSIYYAIGLHILWNSFVPLLELLIVILKMVG
ncbi:CPBP family intramembrane glutamic endopeptidase [Streptococcus jiangjianxini]|uniref:CPBP family intramembrane glutamic endopeptidase n=1 Tax=Streptococcus jiangjianxini TaxID=3161189 RepID=UPI0032F075E3